MPRITNIKPRGGTAAQWTSANPVLSAREMGIETDTQKSKYGDGTTAWNSLPYSVANASGTSTVEWNSVLDKPSTFPPSTHTHVASDVTDIQTYVDGRISLVVDGAPGALDTLNELAAALGDDANFAGTVTTALGGKAPTVHTHSIADITDYVPPVVSYSDTFMMMGA